MEFNDSLGSIKSLIKIDTTVPPTFDTTTNVLTIVGTGAITIPTGTLAQRPVPVIGMVRYNTDQNMLEYSNGVDWRGMNDPVIISYTTSTTTPDQLIETLDATTIRTIKYIVQITSGSEYHAVEMLLTHDGVTAYMTEYAVVLTGTLLATFNATINTGNLDLLVTPTNAVTTIKLIRTTITV